MVEGKLTRLLGWILIAFTCALAGAAHAAGTFASVTGNVMMTGPGGSTVAARQGATIQSGTSISTGAGARAVIKFDDGGAVILDHDTQFKVVDYRYDADRPAQGRSIFDFLKGAARFVTGLVARTEHANYSLRTPLATIGVRGTDFDVVSGSLYISVNNGVVTATNAAGTAAFGGGQTGYVANAGTLAATAPQGLIPGNVSGAITRLNGVALPSGTLAPGAGGGGGAAAAGGGAAGAGEATGGFAGLSESSWAAIGLGVVGATAIGGIHSSSTTTHH